MRGASGIQLDEGEIKTSGQAFTMNFLACAAIIADQIADVATIQVVKRLSKFIELNILQVATITIGAYTLIRGDP